MVQNRSSEFLPAKSRGRPPGSPNKITRDIRAALRDLAEGNSHRVQEWLDRVAETDPAEALRLWLALLRYVTPTLQAAAIADMTQEAHRLTQCRLRRSDAAGFSVGQQHLGSAVQRITPLDGRREHTRMVLQFYLVQDVGVAAAIGSDV